VRVRDASSTDPRARVARAARVRVARRRDLDRLLELWVALIEHHRRLDPRYPVLPALRESLERELARGLEGGDRRLWVAEAGDRAVGFLSAELDGAGAGGERGARIHELYVEPAHRQLGLGRELVSEARRALARIGISRLSVRVEFRNDAALRFWRGQGFLERARLLEST
jgi:ribosomal protein S18 acetylase RimI-like enzyme